MKEKLLDLIEFYKNEGMLFLAACNEKIAFFTSTDHRGYKLWSCQNICDTLSYLFIKLSNNLYRQIFGNPMCTDCAPLVADLFLFCYERIS